METQGARIGRGKAIHLYFAGSEQVACGADGMVAGTAIPCDGDVTCRRCLAYLARCAETETATETVETAETSDAASESTLTTYTVTFYDEHDGDPEDVEIRAVEIRSAVGVDELQAAEWDAHSLVITQARVQGSLGREWESSHITLDDGTVIEALAGL